MTLLRPCRVCGVPSPTSCCQQHGPDRSTGARGYDRRWRVLSERARRLQPFCSDCGSTEDLQADHTPEAWARKAEGKVIRLQDIEVVCGRCNRDRGTAR